MRPLMFMVQREDIKWCDRCAARKLGYGIFKFLNLFILQHLIVDQSTALY